MNFTINRLLIADTIPEARQKENERISLVCPFDVIVVKRVDQRTIQPPPTHVWAPPSIRVTVRKIASESGPDFPIVTGYEALWCRKMSRMFSTFRNTKM
jgi:hypothetical protein